MQIKKFNLINFALPREEKESGSCFLSALNEATTLLILSCLRSLDMIDKLDFSINMKCRFRSFIRLSNLALPQKRK